MSANRFLPRICLFLYLALFVILLGGCATEQTVKPEPPDMQKWIGNFEYQYNQKSRSDTNTIIYYRLFRAYNTYWDNPDRRDIVYWSYPVSVPLASEDLPESLPLEALNRCLAEVCSLLGIVNFQALNLTAEQGTATLNLPEDFFVEIDKLLGGIPKRALDALVLTLTEFADIERVQLLNRGRVQNFITVDWHPYDISQPLRRLEQPNDDTFYQGQGNKVVLYWQLKDSADLVPVTYILPQNGNRLQALFNLLLDVPGELKKNTSEYIALDNFLVSPLASLWGEQQNELPKLCMQGNTLQLNLSSRLLTDYSDDPQLIVALNALTRTFLEISEVERVQFLVDDQAMSITLGLFSLAEPISQLPFINQLTIGD